MKWQDIIAMLVIAVILIYNVFYPHFNWEFTKPVLIGSVIGILINIIYNRIKKRSEEDKPDQK